MKRRERERESKKLNKNMRKQISIKSTIKYFEIQTQTNTRIFVIFTMRVYLREREKRLNIKMGAYT